MSKGWRRFRRWRRKVNVEKALDPFFKGAARGLTLVMVDAGLVYWEIGKKDEGVRMYTRAAELGDPAGQCNLGISYLQGTSSTKKWERQKNKPDEASEQGAVAVAYQVAVPFANLGVWLRSLWLDSVLSLRLIRVQSLRLIKLSGVHESIVLDDKLPSQNNLANEALGLDTK